jgi:hypothetical protein
MTDTCVSFSLLRESYAKTLTRTCTIPGLPRTVSTVTAPGLGGSTSQTWEPDITGVKCSYAVASSNNPVIEEAETLLGTYTMRFEYGIELRSGMIIRVDAKGADPARRFKLISPRDHARMVGQVWTASSYDEEV